MSEKNQKIKRGKKMDGLRTSAIYCWGCKKTKKLKVNKLLADFVAGEQDKEEIVKITKQLQPYLGYLKIAVAVGRQNIFCKEVIKNYWLGGRALRKFKKTLPFHNFETLFLMVSARNNPKIIKKILPKTLNCCVLPGKVKKVLARGQLIVEYFPIEYANGKFYFGKPKEKKIKIGFLKKVEVGDWVSFHLGYGREKIKIKEKEKLLRWTQKSLEILNEH